jgi:hypothetical protein
VGSGRGVSSLVLLAAVLADTGASSSGALAGAEGRDSEQVPRGEGREQEREGAVVFVETLCLTPESDCQRGRHGHWKFGTAFASGKGTARLQCQWHDEHSKLV